VIVKYRQCFQWAKLQAVCAVAIYCTGHVTCQIWLWLENVENVFHGTSLVKQLISVEVRVSKMWYAECPLIFLEARTKKLVTSSCKTPISFYGYFL